MKKTLAYLATAILLGFLVVRLPLAIQTRHPEYLSPLSPPNTQFINPPVEQDAHKDEMSSALRFLGVSGQPSLLPSSLIFFSGLIVALAIYVAYKRRMP